MQTQRISSSDSMMSLRTLMNQAQLEMPHAQFQVVLDDLHHMIDRRAPYLIHGRRGAPRMIWAAGRDLDELYRRINELPGMLPFLDDMVEWASGIIRYLNNGDTFWIQDVAAA